MAKPTFLSKCIEALLAREPLKPNAPAIKALAASMRQVAGFPRGAAYSDHTRKAGDANVPLSIEPRVEAGKVVGLDVILVPMVGANVREAAYIFAVRVAKALFPTIETAAEGGKIERNHRAKERNAFVRDAGAVKGAEGFTLSGEWTEALSLWPEPIYNGSDARTNPWHNLGFIEADADGKPGKGTLYRPVRKDGSDAPAVARLYARGAVTGLTTRSGKLPWAVQFYGPPPVKSEAAPATTPEPAADQDFVTEQAV